MKIKSLKQFFTIVLFFIIFVQIRTPLVFAQGNINGLELNVDNSTGKLTIKANPDGVATEEEAINAGLSKFKIVVLTVMGFATLTMILIFIKNFLILGIASTNPQARGQAITGLIFSGIATAGLGGIIVFVGFFYTLFQ